MPILAQRTSCEDRVDSTPNLGLPYIMAAQSQKHVTHNEAIRALDAVVQLSVLDRNLGAPPSSPAEGARYIVASSPSGAWSGHAGKIAAYQDGAWMFYAPSEGWIAWVADEDIAVVWTGSAWGSLATGEGGSGGGDGDFETLGINATADSTNRLTVAADATLLNHDGDGHQLKINKAEAPTRRACSIRRRSRDAPSWASPATMISISR
jgi:hypothetical protein